MVDWWDDGPAPGPCPCGDTMHPVGNTLRTRGVYVQYRCDACGHREAWRVTVLASRTP